MVLKNILVTGATGYIGSHTCVELINSGYSVYGIDNLAQSSGSVIDRIEKLNGPLASFQVIDIRDYSELDKFFDENDIDAVIHFAGYKAVGESMENPVLYFSNNLRGSVCLLEVMKKHGVKSLIFSSSCTVYGDPEKTPIDESTKLNPKNPYGRTKLWIEEMLNDITKSDEDWRITSLRYFNPIGAHPSGKLGEIPVGIPNNLLPYITQTAVGDRDCLNIFGNDYPTKDGTCIRDYIHVVDLATGHIKALEKLKTGFETYNLGTGVGFSVLEMVTKFIELNDVNVEYKFVNRRPGDAAEVWAKVDKAKDELGWSTQFSLDDMLIHSWNWQKNLKMFEFE
jgi:UDP-glucose 4-epimerase